MAYNVPATSKTPALIIYLIDISKSMDAPMDGVPRIDVLNQSIKKVLRQMIGRSTTGELLSPRYRVAMLAYSNEVHDVLGGVQTITHVAQLGAPRFSTQNVTNTALAFDAAQRILEQQLPHMQSCPAPLVCHLTDGRYTNDDPEPCARQIMAMSNPDGNVLVENVYIGNDLTVDPIVDPHEWRGIQHAQELSDDYARKLLAMSSRVPASYAEIMQENDFPILSGSSMLFPASHGELVEAAFVMSAATRFR